MVGGLGGVHMSGGGGRAAGAWGVITVAASDASNAARQPDYRCDGTADNVEIQAAIDLATVTGGIVQLSDGTFNLAAAVTLKTNVVLRGVGDGTVLTQTGALSSILASLMCASGATRFAIEDMTIDGNASALSTTTAGHGIRLASCTYASIRRVNFRNIGYNKTNLRSCIYLESTCTDTFVEDVRGISVQATPTLWYGLYNDAAVRTTVRRPYFYGCGDEPMVFYNSLDFLWDGGRVCYGADNTAGNGAKGAHITATSGATRGRIINVEADHNYADGFRIDVGGGGTTDVTIINCDCHDNSNVGISLISGGRLIGNRCYNNAGGASNTGIYIGGANNFAQGNYCYDNGVAGIYVSGATDLILIGNVCTNVTGTTQNYGVNVATGTTEVTSIGNNYAGNTTAPIQLDGTGEIKSMFDWLGSGLNVSGLPTSDPEVAGRPWLNSNVLTVSAG